MKFSKELIDRVDYSKEFLGPTDTNTEITIQNPTSSDIQRINNRVQKIQKDLKISSNKSLIKAKDIFVK